MRTVTLCIILTVVSGWIALAQTWQRIEAPIVGTIKSVVRTPKGTILMGTDKNSPVEHALYRSVDDGATFTPKDGPGAGLGSETMFSDLFVDGSGAILARGGYSGTWYRSTDEGVTWSVTGTPSSYRPANQLSDGSQLRGRGRMIQISKNGARWKTIRSISGRNMSVEFVAATVDDHLMVGTVTGEVYRIPRKINGWGVPKLLLRIPHGFAQSCWYGNDGKGIIIGTDSKGAFFSGNSGATWTQRGISVQEPWSFATSVGAVYMFNCYPFIDLMKSTDQGQTWTMMPLNDRSGKVFIVARAMVGTRSGALLIDGVYSEGLYVSRDGGNSFSRIKDSLANSGQIEMFTVQNSGAILAASAQGLLQSSNDGASWRLLYPGPVMFVTEAPGGTIFGALGRENSPRKTDGIIRSTNGGSTWDTINTGLDNSEIRAITSGSGNTVLAAGAGGLYRSTNSGNAWTKLGGAVERTDFTGFLAGGNGRIYARAGSHVGYYDADAGGIYVTSDNGENWETMNTGLATKNVIAFTFTPDGSLIAGTERSGVFRIPASQVVPVTAPRTLVEANSRQEYALHENFPNPFNPSTTISFDLPVSSIVTLRVFNMLGQEVAILANGEFAAGEHRVEFNGSNMPSGTYYCRFEARMPDDLHVVSSGVMRMLLVK